MSVLSWSSLEPLISLDLVTMKLYCFRAWAHCYFCLYIISQPIPWNVPKSFVAAPNFPTLLMIWPKLWNCINFMTWPLNQYPVSNIQCCRHCGRLPLNGDGFIDNDEKEAAFKFKTQLRLECKNHTSLFIIIYKTGLKRSRRQLIYWQRSIIFCYQTESVNLVDDKYKFDLLLVAKLLAASTFWQGSAHI